MCKFRVTLGSGWECSLVTSAVVVVVPGPWGSEARGYQSDANFGEPEDGKNTERMRNSKDQV